MMKQRSIGTSGGNFLIRCYSSSCDFREIMNCEKDSRFSWNDNLKSWMNLLTWASMVSDILVLNNYIVTWKAKKRCVKVHMSWYCSSIREIASWSLIPFKYSGFSSILEFSTARCFHNKLSLLRNCTCKGLLRFELFLKSELSTMPLRLRAASMKQSNSLEISSLFEI